MKNTQLKSRPVTDPYEIWEGTLDMGYGDVLHMTWRVLKKWQVDDDKPYARWYVAAKSEATYGEWEYGDTYVQDIKHNGHQVAGGRP